MGIVFNRTYSSLVLLAIFSGFSCDSSNTDNETFLALSCLIDSSEIESTKIEIEETHSFSDGSLLKERTAVYSEMGIRAEIEGEVIVGFDLDKYGKKSNIYIYGGIGGGLDEASLFAVKKQNFIPALQNQKRICTRSFVILNFDIDNAENVTMEITDYEEVSGFVEPSL